MVWFGAVVASLSLWRTVILLENKPNAFIIPDPLTSAID